jgi:hypothetical protein
VSKIDFSVDKIVVELPFMSRNSSWINEPEELRARLWKLQIGGVNLKSIEAASIHDIYEKFEVKLSKIGLKFGKRDYPCLLNAIEEFDILLMVKLKSKLRDMLREEMNTVKEVVE